MPPKRKREQLKSASSRKKAKTSDEFCEEYGLVNPVIEFGDGDFKNLSTYNIFVQHVRPQIVKANPTLRSYRNLASVLCARWKEFQAVNPFSPDKKVETSKESEGQTSHLSDKSDDDDDEGLVARKTSSKKKLKASQVAKKKSKPIIESDISEDKDDVQNESDGPKSDKEDTKEDTNEDTKDDTSRKEDTNDDTSRKEDTKDDTSRKEDTKDDTSRRSKTDINVKEADVKKKRIWSMKIKPLKPQVSEDADSDGDDEGNASEFETLQKSVKRKRKQVKDLSKEMSDRQFNRLLKDGGPVSEGRHARKLRSQVKTTYDSSMDDESEGSEEMMRKLPERKSSRKMNVQYGYTEISNQEFEKLLKKGLKKKSSESDESGKKGEKRKKKSEEEDSEYSLSGLDSSSSEEVKVKKDKTFEARGKRIRRKKRKQRLKVTKIRERKKGSDNEEDGRNANSSDESDHNYWCEICNDGGELLLCDTCPRVFHQDCLQIQDIPDGKWSCPICVEELSDHEQWCAVCRDGGDMILCDRCPNVYHMECLNPPMAELPEGDWLCPRCSCNPPKGHVKMILFWRWTEPPKDADELDHTPSSPLKKPSAHKPEREFFVRFTDMSYWQCDWISELQLEVFHLTMLKFYRRKQDMDDPPSLEDGSTYGMSFSHRKKTTEEIGLNLEERFYRYGIKPEWLQIHRIVEHRNRPKGKQYLVKWMDTYYDHCTWETNETAKDVPNFLEKVHEYEQRRELFKKKDTKGAKKDSKGPKRSTLRVKLSQQPDYLCGGTLHPYQLEGLNWLRFSWSQDTNTILADEMGLGKTIQTAAFLLCLWKEKYSQGPFLISAPLSTVTNWERELKFWAPDLYVVTYTGGKDTRQLIREHEFSYQVDAMKSGKRLHRLKENCRVKFDVLLTSYELVSIDKTTLSSIKWAMLVIDEAHRLKNNQSLFFRVLSSYDIQYKLLLTGTPLQNNLEELFNLLNFMSPDKFSEAEKFLEDFSDDFSKEDQVTKLHDLLAPHLLRRIKADVLKDMPSKSESIVRIELSPMQKKYYKYILTKNFELLNARGMEKCSLMNLWMDLRKCCNHPYLFPSAYITAPLASNGAYEGEALTKASGKLELLAKMLKVLKRDNHRVLIFSQMTKVLDVLEDFLDHMDIGYERIDGNVGGNDRQMAIDRFNSENSKKFVFLLSTRAGGLGINLASADTVVIYDQDWNPHNDIQALSRAHRIGQKNKVMIYRFVTRNTIEEKMAHVAKRKMMLHNLVVRPGASGTLDESMSKTEINDIIKFGTENLFKDSEEHQVIYDDEMIEKMLDRTTGPATEEESSKGAGLDEYFSSFKVASYITNEGKSVEEEQDEEKENEEIEKQEFEKGYWENIVGSAYMEQVKEERKKVQLEKQKFHEEFGRGKRARGRIEYNETKILKSLQAEDEEDDEKEDVIENAVYITDYEPTSSSDDDEDQGVEDEDGIEDKPWFMKKDKRKGTPSAEKLPMPPLLCTRNGCLEVLGFNARERKLFYTAVMAFGLPHQESGSSQWQYKDHLKHKPLKVMRAYTTLFLKHLCETPIAPDKKGGLYKYSDGIPTEGLNPTTVLTRMGILALIRRKVHDYETLLGTSGLSFSEIIRKVKVTKKQKLTALEPTEKPKDGDVVVNDTTEDSSCKADVVNDTTEDSSCKADVVNDTTEGSSCKADVVNDTTEGSSCKADDNKDASDSNQNNEVSEESSENRKSVEPEGNGEKRQSVKPEGNDENRKNVEPEGNGEKRESVELEGNGEKRQSVEPEGNGEKRESVEPDGNDENRKSVEPEGNGEKRESVEPEGNGEKKQSVKPEGNTVDMDVVGENEVKVKEDGKELEEMDESKGQVDKTEIDEKAKEKMPEQKPDQGRDTDTPEEDKNIIDNDGTMNKLSELFYIEDGRLTDLHNIWQFEDEQVAKYLIQKHPSVVNPEQYIWCRLHDYFLLATTLVHGYRQWAPSCQDQKYRIIMEPFKLTENTFIEKIPYWNRRLQLLEQALVYENILFRCLDKPSEDLKERQKQLKELSIKILDAISGNLHNVDVKLQATACHIMEVQKDWQFQKHYSLQMDPCLNPTRRVIQEKAGQILKASGKLKPHDILQKRLNETPCMEDQINEMRLKTQESRFESDLVKEMSHSAAGYMKKTNVPLAAAIVDHSKSQKEQPRPDDSVEEVAIEQLGPAETSKEIKQSSANVDARKKQDDTKDVDDEESDCQVVEVHDGKETDDRETHLSDIAPEEHVAVDDYSFELNENLTSSDEEQSNINQTEMQGETCAIKDTEKSNEDTQAMETDVVDKVGHDASVKLVATNDTETSNEDKQAMETDVVDKVGHEVDKVGHDASAKLVATNNTERSNEDKQALETDVVDKVGHEDSTELVEKVNTDSQSMEYGDEYKQGTEEPLAVEIKEDQITQMVEDDK